MKWFSAIAIVAMLFQCILLAISVLTPFLGSDFSATAWRAVVSDVAFVLGFFALGIFYDRTKTEGLLGTPRFLINSLFCVGGLAYFASYLLLLQQHYKWALLLLLFALLMLTLGRLFTDAAHAVRKKATGHVPGNEPW
jgi:hypothetical protein